MCVHRMPKWPHLIRQCSRLLEHPLYFGQTFDTPQQLQLPLNNGAEANKSGELMVKRILALSLLISMLAGSQIACGGAENIEARDLNASPSAGTTPSDSLSALDCYNRYKLCSQQGTGDIQNVTWWQSICNTWCLACISTGVAAPGFGEK